MSLPKISAPYYTLIIPSTKQQISYRPYLVGEQKLILMANETDDREEAIKLIKQVVINCTDDKVNIEVLPLFDVEYIFLKLRAKSVGEVVEPVIRCSKCRKSITLQIKIDDIEVSNLMDNKIMITNTIGMILKYPTLEIENQIKSINNDNRHEILYNCTESIFDENQVYTKSDFTKDEFSTMIDSLSTDQYNKIMDFFAKMPTVKKEVTYECKHCGNKSTILLEGLQDFLD